MQNYSKYLDTRIRAYRDLKHDAIRVQSESNRDLRNSQAVEEDLQRGSKRGKGGSPSAAPAVSSGIQRSKTMAGRKLRIMTVEKGLLRETKVVQKMVDALIDCRVRSIMLCAPLRSDHQTVLFGRSRRRAQCHRTPNARERPPHLIPSLQRRRNQRLGTLLRNVTGRCDRCISDIPSFLQTDGTCRGIP
jgi:hypothetical protein